MRNESCLGRQYNTHALKSNTVHLVSLLGQIIILLNPNSSELTVVFVPCCPVNLGRAALVQELGADGGGHGDSRAGQPRSPGLQLHPAGGSASERAHGECHKWTTVGGTTRTYITCRTETEKDMLCVW